MNTPHYIAIADDMINVRLALRVLLESLPNISIVKETDDIEALLVDSNGVPAPDLLLLDWELGGPNYKDTITRIRSRYPGLKILIVSVQLDSRQQAIAAGADSFFYKGDPGNMLQAEITHLLGTPAQ